MSSLGKPTTTARYTDARITSRPNLNHLVTISDQSGRPLIVLGAFSQSDNAHLYAEILAGETGLPHEIDDPPRPVSLQWADRIVASDKRALENPIRTKPLPLRFTA